MAWWLLFQGAVGHRRFSEASDQLLEEKTKERNPAVLLLIHIDSDGVRLLCSNLFS